MSRDTNLLPGEARQRKIDALLEEMNNIAMRLSDEDCVVIAGISYESPIMNRAHVVKIMYGSPITCYGMLRVLEARVEDALYDGEVEGEYEEEDDE